MQLIIKNMVCNRCIKVVLTVLEEFNLEVETIQLGSLQLKESMEASQLQALQVRFVEEGFEIIFDADYQLVEEIKALIIQQIHHQTSLKPEYLNYSDWLMQHLKHDYSKLSFVFSKCCGITIEKYIIQQKTEKVKELLSYNQLNLSEIAFELHYSSVQHLSTQFKKVTGLSPTAYKQLHQTRTTLDSI